MNYLKRILQIILNQIISRVGKNWTVCKIETLTTIYTCQINFFFLKKCEMKNVDHK